MRIAINGFGRIGRAAAKIILDESKLELAAVNDLGDIATLAYLMKYDSCFGPYHQEVKVEGNNLIIESTSKVNGVPTPSRCEVKFYAQKDPGQLPWGDLGIDVVIESTGIFLTQEKAQPHIKAGAKKVVLSAPAKDEATKTYLIGVNADKYAGEEIVSNASCTTNCIAPIMAVLDKELGISKSLMTTVHSYTADQNLVDGPHADLRRARAAAINIVPTTTGAAKAVGKVMPSLLNKFDGLSIRVPSSIVSISDITALVKKDTSVQDINAILLNAAEHSHYGIIETSSEPLVSTDLIGHPASAIVDMSLTQVIDGNLIKVVAWYDNEWGYSNRLVELAELVGTK